MRTYRPRIVAWIYIAGMLLSSAAGSDAALGDGLVEYWKLDGTYHAEVTTNHIGTLQAKGTGLTGSGFVSGKFDRGIDLESSDGDNQASVVIGGDENDFDFVDGSMSVSVWYTTESLYTAWQALVGKGENASWRLARNGSSTTHIKLSVWLTADGELDQQDGSWHHAVATLDVVAGHRIYVDGNLVSSNATPAELREGTFPMQIGGNPQADNRGWDGIIDDVGIWNRALTPDEVAAMWNNGDGASIGSLTGVGEGDLAVTDLHTGDAGLVITWTTQNGQFYTLQTTDDPRLGHWLEIGDATYLMGEGATITFTNALMDGMEFYRVIQEP